MAAMRERCGAGGELEVARALVSVDYVEATAEELRGVLALWRGGVGEGPFPLRPTRTLMTGLAEAELGDGRAEAVAEIVAWIAVEWTAEAAAAAGRRGDEEQKKEEEEG